MTEQSGTPSSHENEEPNSNEHVTKIGPARLLINTIALPGDAFKEINRRPTWLAPMVIAVLVMMAGNAVYYWRVNPNWEQRVRARIEQHRTTTGQVLSGRRVVEQPARRNLEKERS